MGFAPNRIVCFVRLRATRIAAAIEKSLYGELRRLTGHAEGDLWFALSPDGKKVVSGCWGRQPDYVARVWDVETGKELRRLEGHTNGIICVAWSPDGKRLMSGGYDRTVRLWDAETGKHLKTLEDVYKDWVHFVLFTSDAKKAIVAANEPTIRIWDLEAGKVERRSANIHTRCEGWR
jgi:WD40 repeat protein